MVGGELKTWGRLRSKRMYEDEMYKIKYFSNLSLMDVRRLKSTPFILENVKNINIDTNEKFRMRDKSVFPFSFLLFWPELLRLVRIWIVPYLCTFHFPFLLSVFKYLSVCTVLLDWVEHLNGKELKEEI